MAPPPRPPRAPAGARAAPPDALNRALLPPHARLLHTLPSAAHAAPGALDALLLHSVALVAYASGGAAVVARGTDLGALRVLDPGAGACTAVAFRARDGALAAAFGPRVVVFHGWTGEGALYDGKVCMRADAPFARVSALAWDAAGEALVAVGEGVCKWEVRDGGGGDETLERVVCFRARLPGGGRLDVGALSPDGTLVAGAAMHARVGWVWPLDALERGGAAAEDPDGAAAAACAELVFGWSGVAAMQWKARGGGGPSLMTVDRDGTLRLWARVSAAQVAEKAAGVGAGTWMEEVARSPHVEDTPRAGAAFVQWGGGGGVADDESDAAAGAAAHPFVAAGAAPKPSRALHWIVRVAAGDVRAWRVRGLDDQPRPEFARLEPGGGSVVPTGRSASSDEDALVRMDSGAGGRNALDGAVVVATRALAPVPLTTSNSRRVGLVKSYATSNGERRLRSPEPPEPPAMAAAFVLVTRNGRTHIARYDLSPTDDAHAVCRARVGEGHVSTVCGLTVYPTSFSSDDPGASSRHESSTSWVLSAGVDGDTRLWRADAASPTREPLVLSAMLPGPHVACAFAPPSLASERNRDGVVAMFGVDAISQTLHLYQYVVRTRHRTCSSVQTVSLAQRLASCASGNNTGGTVRKLLSVPLLTRKPRRKTSKLAGASAPQNCLLVGVAENGRACCWYVSRARHEGEAHFEPAMMRFSGRRFGVVTAADAAVELGTGRRLIAIGSVDGCVRLYEVVHDPDVVDSDTGSEDEDVGGTFGRGRLADDIGEDRFGDGALDGVVRFRELAFLGEKDGSEACVTHVTIMSGGERVGITREDGSLVVWERSLAVENQWSIALSVPSDGDGGEKPGSSMDDTEEVAADDAEENSVGGSSSGEEDMSSLNPPGGIAFGRDAVGQVVVFASRDGGSTDVFRKRSGAAWEKNVVTSTGHTSRGPITHIGLGVVVACKGRSILAYDGALSTGTSYAKDGAGYSPSRNIIAHLFAGGHAWQAVASLKELAAHIEVAAGRTMGVGGLHLPPPVLREILSSSETSPGLSAPAAGGSTGSPETRTALGFEDDSTGMSSRNLFTELMARSEAKFVAEETQTKKSTATFDDGMGSAPPLKRLCKRLEMLSISGLSSMDHGVLKGLAEASIALGEILPSLDPAGCRFALIAATFLRVSDSLPLPPAVVACAVHSSATDALSSHFLPTVVASAGRVRLAGSSGAKPPSMWVAARRLGAGWWLSTRTGATTLIERMARTDFSSTRDADSAALWYVALGRVKPLSALYRAQHNVRMAQFLMRNFKMKDNQVAAGKNAYVLASKHRYFLATAFFILAGDVVAALRFVRDRLRDDQLALILSRVLENGSPVSVILESMLATQDVQSDHHKHGMTLWLNGKHDEALKVVGARCPSVPETDELSELEKSLGFNISPLAFSLGHIAAMTGRPPLRGTPGAIRALSSGRERAMHVLTANGSPVVALSLGLNLLADGVEASEGGGATSHSSHNGQTVLSRDTPLSTLSKSRRVSVIRHVTSTAAVALKERAVAASMSLRFGFCSHGGILETTEADLRDLCHGSLATPKCVRVACTAATELSRIDEIDSALALALGAARLCHGSRSEHVMLRLAESRVEDVCYLACARAVSKCLCALSPLHRPNATADDLNTLCGRMRIAVRMLRSLEPVASDLTFDLHQVTDALKRAILALKISRAYLRGEWADLLSVLRACEQPPASLRVPKVSGALDELDEDDGLSRRSTSSSLAPESISLENLRHIASNPAVLGLSSNIGHRRRRRRAPSLALVDQDGVSLAAVVDETGPSSPSVAMTGADPVEFIRAHPALNYALGCSVIDYLASHQAARAARLVSRKGTRSGVSDTSIQDIMNISRVLEASETLEHVSADAIAGWIPLARFGAVQDSSSLASREDMAGAFVDLWCALGCLPEYAPSLSEAATVAAAELASAAARRASADHGLSARAARRRRRRQQQVPGTSGAVASTDANKVSDIFDTTSADSLYGAYPVRFSASAGGPWSGRGRFACLYSENSALFRTLCISSSDPPAVVVATPKGIQEVVPSSYTAMPAGFRSHYFASRKETGLAEAPSRESVENHAEDDRVPDDRDPTAELVAGLETGYGESAYMALDMKSNGAQEGSNSSKRSSYSANGRDAVWRHQVEATALASHPLRRRFASGGTDGVVRIWDCGDPISLGALRCKENPGRVSALKYTAYGNALVSVHSSGQVAVWHEPDSSMSTTTSRLRERDVTFIEAFHSRNASDVEFLDEGFLIAAVGDPTSPPAVGHSLRIFDTREPNVSFQASWSARVHNGGEARCLALLEDRVRVVTGGLDGTLSVVDLRMSKSATQSANQARVAELPAHDDEVTCLTLESPRGRALVSGCRDGDIKIWDSRTLLQLDHITGAHPSTRHYWSGSGIGGMVGSYGTQAVALTDRSLISCGGDGIVKVWGPGYSTSDLNVL